MTDTPKNKKLFVVDTNVLLFDHTAIYNFEEHDVAISIVVLEELDRFKRGNDLINIEARDFIRELDRLAGDGLLTEGLPLGEGARAAVRRGGGAEITSGCRGLLREQGRPPHPRVGRRVARTAQRLPGDRRQQGHQPEDEGQIPRAAGRGLRDRKDPPHRSPVPGDGPFRRASRGADLTLLQGTSRSSHQRDSAAHSGAAPRVPHHAQRQLERPRPSQSPRTGHSSGSSSAPPTASSRATPSRSLPSPHFTVARPAWWR